MTAIYEDFLKKIQDELRQKERGSAEGPERDSNQQKQKQEIQMPKQTEGTRPTAEPSTGGAQPRESKDRKGLSFKTFYEEVCDNIRSSGTLDTIMQDFQAFETDIERVSYVALLEQVKDLTVRENYAMKNAENASNYEKVYDMLIPNEASATKALDVMKKCLQKTPVEDTKALAIRYMKRAWAFLLLEQFDCAKIDAKKSLTFNCPEELIWNSYEILGHTSTKKREYKEAETFFLKALENLRKSNVSNDVKASATSRMMVVFKNVKGRKNDKIKSKKSAENQKKMNHRLPEVSYGPHKTYIAASSALDFITTADKGRCTVTNRDIKPGDILMVDTPYCNIVSPDAHSTHCYHCCRRCPVPTPCSSCAKVCYCSEECRVASWEGPHALECHVLDHFSDSSIGKLAGLAFRTLLTVTWPELKRMRQENELTEGEKQDDKSPPKKLLWNGIYDPQDYKTVFYQSTNASKRTFGDLFKRSLTAVYLGHCLKLTGFFGQEQVDETDFLFVVSFLLRHLQGASTNAYEISEYELGPNSTIIGSKTNEIGVATYTTISLTNHSCVSNAVRYNIGDTGILRATRSIPRGEEVFDNYGYSFHLYTVTERQEVLQSQYRFTCDCEACIKSWPMYPHHPEETLIFRCPAQNCGHSCCYSNSIRKKCNWCGATEQYSKLLLEIETQLKTHRETLTKLKVNDINGALANLFSHQSFLDCHIVEPVKHFTDVQEAIKQCYNFMGNRYDPQGPVSPEEIQQQPNKGPKSKRKTKSGTQN